jgi:hypothetical protein
MTKAPLRERLRWRVRNAAQHALLRVAGRELVCSECGRPILRGLPIVWRGRVRVIGISEHRVHVAFKDQSSLEFRHMQLDHCPSPDRPWVP